MEVGCDAREDMARGEEGDDAENEPAAFGLGEDEHQGQRREGYGPRVDGYHDTGVRLRYAEVGGYVREQPYGYELRGVEDEGRACEGYDGQPLSDAVLETVDGR